ncbi:aspartyl/asparaginyl beta-hydroxylase domain-containing protein [Patiriisocius hiemis]|uniref:Aspartyl/asparaginyl beta-hydroxylase domain-containing protein n=1 Tax=Patiriisocius hiemis TaxID=3075604 RepID=A0ABU2YDR5_9FLAO|nr:aspartyl/asparaginyl beta-hydroxylase domain-containing protein [Constantimarinum sp. W242]MDT0556328.1 aspartyl/asparaginyl beta-hydroxylase domain-containing protein [Constantimarinum sp. W242]
MKNSYFKLPFSFLEEELVNDFKICLENKFTDHFNSSDYEGVWSSISLRSPSGSISDIKAHSNNNFIDTKLLDACSYFKEIIGQFKCEKESIRILNLEPNSKIKEHRDLNLGYEDGVFRIHIPIITNNEVLFFINNKLVKMAVGSCWYGNFNLPHRVENNGATQRVHLVMDCIRNNWSDTLFEKIGYDFSFEKKEPIYDIKTKRKMIEALKLQDNEAAKELITTLQREIATTLKNK